ncbi:MAG: ABC transporter permease [Parcubacteria group bacterium]|nr:ABC transporter permease [Parcubacteria group bacterium]
MGERHSLAVLDLFKLSLRVFKTKPMRTFLTVLGMSVGVGTVLFLISLGYGLQYILIGKLVATEDSLITLDVSYPTESGLNITGRTMEEISRLEETEEISPVAEFTGELKSDGLAGLVVAKIVEPRYFRLSGNLPDIGMTFSEFEPALIASNAALQLTEAYQTPPFKFAETDLGKKFSLKVFYEGAGGEESDAAESKESLPLKGIINDEFQPPFVIVPAGFLSKEPPFYKSLLVKAKNIDLVAPLQDKLVDRGFITSARVDLVNQASKVMSGITIILGVFGVTALIVSAIGMFNTMIVGFLERIYEVGIMKSLGATDKDVRNLFLTESLLMGLMGGIGGVILGIGGGKLFNYGLNILAARLGGEPFTLFIVPYWFVAVTLVLSAAIGLISGFWPARRAARLSPKEAFKV